MFSRKELVALDQQEMHNEDLDNLIKIPRHVANGAFKEIRGFSNLVKIALFLYPKYKWGFIKKKLFKA